MAKFLIDENVPLPVVEILKNKGFDAELTPPRMKNSRIAELAIRESRIVVTGDKDFLALRKDLQINVKVIHVRVHPKDPVNIIRLIDRYIERGLKALEKTNIVQLTETGITIQ